MIICNQIRINFNPNNEVYNSITEILGIAPKEDDFEIMKKMGIQEHSSWTYETIQMDDDEYYDFINNFLNILEPKFNELENIGIRKSDITFWMLYEYDQQCNLEFNPNRLKRIGENDITLCISCWDSGQENK